MLNVAYVVSVNNVFHFAEWHINAFQCLFGDNFIDMLMRVVAIIIAILAGNLVQQAALFIVAELLTADVT